MEWPILPSSWWITTLCTLQLIFLYLFRARMKLTLSRKQYALLTVFAIVLTFLVWIGFNVFNPIPIPLFFALNFVLIGGAVTAITKIYLKRIVELWLAAADPSDDSTPPEDE